MRKLIYYVATSIDGFVSREDGSFETFLATGPHIQDYLDSLDDFDTVVMGRKTYEAGYLFGLNPGEAAYKQMTNYVFSRTLAFDSPDKALKVISHNAGDTVKGLKNKEGTDIYLCGGGNFAGFLLDNHLIDELRLKLNPILLGSGIPLFGKSRTEPGLELYHHKIYENGVMFLNYHIHY